MLTSHVIDSPDEKMYYIVVLSAIWYNKVLIYRSKKDIHMKVVILAGGFGTRISEESHLKPKPMIEIGNQPILWHIMKTYSYYGYNDFIICAGYKQDIIKEFFSNYFLHSSDITFDLKNNTVNVHDNFSESWKVTIVDTGITTMTGGRIKRIQKYIGEESFFLTYGDGVSNVNIENELAFHKTHGKTGTLTAISAGQRFGVLGMGQDNQISTFREKCDADASLINGGFMILEPSVFEYIQNDSTVFEEEPLEKLAVCGQLMAYRHDGYWQCMDTQRDKQTLDKLWNTGTAPWKIW